MVRISSLLIAAVLLAVNPRPAGAQDVTVWHCWYEADGKFQLTCDLPQSAPAGETLNKEWRRALDSNELVLAARLVRQNPSEFAARRMYIPLFGPPAQDLHQAERLARAVMCWRQADCVVAFDSSLGK